MAEGKIFHKNANLRQNKQPKVCVDYLFFLHTPQIYLGPFSRGSDPEVGNDCQTPQSTALMKPNVLHLR